MNVLELATSYRKIKKLDLLDKNINHALLTKLNKN